MGFQHELLRGMGHQIVQDFPWDTAPRFIIRDRDIVFGARFRGRVNGMGIEEEIRSRDIDRTQMRMSNGTCPR